MTLSVCYIYVVLRRQAITVLLGNWLRADALIVPFQGTALLADIRTRKLISIHGAENAGTLLVPPGSTIKPFALAALQRAGKVSPADLIPCPGKLSIGGRSFDCSHPRLTSPLSAREAIAYSCNYFVAQVAQRFESGELAGYLQRAGLGSLTGWSGTREATGRISPAQGSQRNQLQALGEDPLQVTTAGLAMGYRTLALNARQPEMQSVLEGLEDAVEYGTAQAAKVAGLKVAGKTGTVRTAAGSRIAWFAGFAPSRRPEVVVTVMLQGRSGGSDAAPIAARILDSWRSSKP